jgi:UPF0042 nucleotide-binding protein
VTGISGAGKSSALRVFEDLGYEAIDNIPLSIIVSLVQLTQEKDRDLVIGVDVRSRDFSPDFMVECVRQLKSVSTTVMLTTLFLDCDDEVLQKRFAETRREHPLAPENFLLDSIHNERHIMMAVKQVSDMILDTSLFGNKDLKRWLAERFFRGGKDLLTVSIISFSYKKGLPREADMVFDVRFLQNPYYNDALRDLSGVNESVGAYIEQDSKFTDFFKKLCDYVTFIMPGYRAEGRRYVTLAIGCTGGMHRSVYVSNKLADTLRAKGLTVFVYHRDL